MTEKNANIFSLRLQKLLSKKNMTQKDLSEKIKISPSKISRCANGELPDIATLLKLADFFHVSTDYLLGRTDVSTSNPSIQAAVKYTGLSERTLNNVRHLQPFQEQFNALDYLLRADNQAELLIFLMGISDCRKCVSINKQDKIEQQKKEDSFNAALEKEGIVYLSPDKAARYYAQTAAYYLNKLCLKGLEGKDGES